MQEKNINGIHLLFFENLQSHDSLFHAVSTRIGGVSPEPFHSLNLGIHTEDAGSNILANYEALSKALNFDLQSVVTSHQVHKTAVARIDNVPDRKAPFPREHALDGYDAFITDRPGITLMVRVADCVPVILFDPYKKVLAVVHAGWKGTLGGIAGQTVKSMAEWYGCAAPDIRGGIGPSIGPCCFSVQKDVADLFRGQPNANKFIHDEGKDACIDLPAANRLQLIDAGCSPKSIEMSRLCTACNLNLFFSHRGEQGKTGRFGLLAGLRP